jgi:peptidoglycan hydrolase-like protein with peptidoglycan-binding domain
MAFVMGGAGVSGAKLYNVEQAVGLNSPNANTDVKLVQYMLSQLYGNIAVDGFIGPVTIAAIRKFQEDAKKGGANVLVDSRIDRAFGQVSSVSKTTYAILLLNFALAKKHPAAFSSLPQQVPLSANPKPNPYNPMQKKIKSIAVTYGNPKKVTVTYVDGSTDVYHVSGKVVINGESLG